MGFRTGRLSGRIFFWWLILAVAVLAGAEAQATTSKTAIVDVLYRADGASAHGTLLISWPAFTTAGGDAIAAGSMTVNLGANGSVQTAVFPNTGSTPQGTYYKVVVDLDDGTRSTEYWVVPQVAQTTIAAVRSSLVPQSQAMQFVGRDYVDSAIAGAVSNLVDLTGTQTITGVKTFQNSPQMPAPKSPGDGANQQFVLSAVGTPAAQAQTSPGTMNATQYQVNGIALASSNLSDGGSLANVSQIPTQTSQLTNNSGFITTAGVPVQSVNGMTGSVSLTIPAPQVSSDWSAASGVAEILNKPTIGSAAMHAATDFDAAGAAASVAATVPAASNTSPAMDGAASTGMANTFARADHVHPTDISRQAAMLGVSSNGANGMAVAGSVAVGTTVQVQSGTLLAAVTSLPSGGTLVVSGVLTVPSTYVTPFNVKIRVENGGSINVSSSQSLQIGGPFEAGQYQVFTGAGSVSFTQNHVVDFTWFGADPTDTNDSAPSFAAGVAPYRSKGSSLTNQIPTFSLPAGKYRTNTAVNWTDLYGFTLKTAGASSTMIDSYATVSSGPNVPAVDVTGNGGAYDLGALTIYGEPSSSPGVALLGGQGDGVNAWCANNFRDISVAGTFTVGGILIEGACLTVFYNPRIEFTAPLFGIGVTGVYDYASQVASPYTAQYTGSFSNDHVNILNPWIQDWNTGTSGAFDAIIYRGVSDWWIKGGYAYAEPLADAVVALDLDSAGGVSSAAIEDLTEIEGYFKYGVHFTSSGLSAEPGTPTHSHLRINNMSGGGIVTGNLLYGDSYTWVSDLNLGSSFATLNNVASTTPTYTANSPTISFAAGTTFPWVTNTPIQLSCSGTGCAVPSGFTAGSAYYVVSPSASALTLQLAVTPGGTAITPTNTGTGTQIFQSYVNADSLTFDILESSHIGRWWSLNGSGTDNIYARKVQDSELRWGSSYWSNMNVSCTAAGTPATCCTGVKTGTCTIPGTIGTHYGSTFTQVGETSNGFTAYDNGLSLGGGSSATATGTTGGTSGVIPVTGSNGKLDTSFIPVAAGGGPTRLCIQATPISNTGSTSEVNLWNCAIPAGTMGATSRVSATLWFESASGDTGNCTLMSRYSATSGTTTLGLIAGSVTATGASKSGRVTVEIVAANSTSSQQANYEHDGNTVSAQAGGVSSGFNTATTTTYFSWGMVNSVSGDTCLLQDADVVLWP